VLRQIRRGLRSRDGVPTQVLVDVLIDAEAAEDALAIGRALPP
jgi:hypothetical protein